MTIDAAKNMAPYIREAGFKTFFVPQSLAGDLHDYVKTFNWAAGSDLVDYIGVSILGVPLAYDVEKNNKLQRFNARWRMMYELHSHGILNTAKTNGKKIHFLGMVDGPNEIMLVSNFHHFIDTWDSSSAIWAGLNNISYDLSPTGLIDGKFELEVDFNFKTYDVGLVQLAQHNRRYIDMLTGAHNDKA